MLLAGDAAHRFPPAGAFGMNTGIQVWLPPTEGLLLRTLHANPGTLHL